MMQFITRMGKRNPALQQPEIKAAVNGNILSLPVEWKILFAVLLLMGLRLAGIIFFILREL